ncbi:MAG: hypothetical protein Q4E34_01025 [Synergistaceae bacterium]|nr:hypothetical protein [Synergistaceae bacterium]
MSRRDLWRLTLGEVFDRIHAWHYSQYLIDLHNAELAFYIGAVFGGKIKSPEELCGKFVNGTVMNLSEARNFYSKRK